MRVLGIESSCDETGLALLELEANGRTARLVSEVLSSQVLLHAQYGGVVPELASREHMRNLPVLFDDLMTRSGFSVNEIDAIGVTVGPGLKGCLLMGVTFALGIQAAYHKPVFPVNHIEGHILSGELHYPELTPPYIALVVSGGHTEVILVEGLGLYRCLARTLDDASGEAFDKSANLLNLGYPGGALLAKIADAAGPSKRFALPRVGREIEGFSFSGLKTAVLLLVKRNLELLNSDPSAKGALAWTIQDSIVDALVNKVVKEVKKDGLPLVVCGGVSANKELQRRLKAVCPKVYVPPVEHCVDNGAMIAYVAARYLNRGIESPTLDIKSRWPVESLGGFYGVGSAHK